MDPIIELAGRLGKAITESPQAAKLHQARKSLDQHKDLVQLLKDYQAQAEKTDRLEQENKPIEVEDKHKLQDLRDRLVASDVFKAYTAAQVEYVNLMRQVSDAMRKELAEVEKQ